MALTKIIANTPQTPNNSDAQDWASMLNAIVGGVSGVLTYGNELEVEIVNDNKIKIKDGVYSLQGHMIRNHKGTDLELTVNSGTLGVKRIDLLVVTYEKNINNQEDDVFEFEVVQGEAIASNDGNPTPPSITQNDLLEGGTKRQEVLYELHINETTLSLVDKRQFVTSVRNLEDRIEGAVGDMADYVIEYGTIPTGTYEKWNSGKLVLRRSSDYATESWVWNFEIPFVNNPVLLAFPVGDIRVWQQNKTNTSATIGFSGGGYVQVMAIGRWK